MGAAGRGRWPAGALGPGRHLLGPRRHPDSRIHRTYGRRFCGRDSTRWRTARLGFVRPDRAILGPGPATLPEFSVAIPTLFTPWPTHLTARHSIAQGKTEPSSGSTHERSRKSALTAVTRRTCWRSPSIPTASGLCRRASSRSSGGGSSTAIVRAQRPGHSGPVQQLVFSGDGRRLISAGGDGSIRLWNGQTGESIGRWTAHANGSIRRPSRTTAASQPAEAGTAWFASGTRKRGTSAVLLQPPAGRPAMAVESAPATVRWLAFSPLGILRRLDRFDRQSALAGR